MKISSATTKYIRIGPTKFERLLSKIRGQSYKETMDILKSTHEKVAAVIWKTVYSATSNARERYKCKRELLIISEAFVNQGPMLKRMRPRAKGRGVSIQKKFSHLTIIVSVLPDLPKEKPLIQSIPQINPSDALFTPFDNSIMHIQPEKKTAFNSFVNNSIAIRKVIKKRELVPA